MLKQWKSGAAHSLWHDAYSNQGGIATQLDGKQSVKLRERAQQAFEKV